MTKMELAIAKLRALPRERQEELADYLIDLAEGEENPYQLTDEQLEEVRLALKEADEGKFATEEEMAALWKKFGL
jgi:predicted transcriptional regulator